MELNVLLPDQAKKADAPSGAWEALLMGGLPYKNSCALMNVKYIDTLMLLSSIMAFGATSRPQLCSLVAVFSYFPTYEDSPVKIDIT